MWYYCTLTIRESILKVNGSRIKGWWRLHHFISTVVAGVLLIWPQNEPWNEFRHTFMWFIAYISKCCLFHANNFLFTGVIEKSDYIATGHSPDDIQNFTQWINVFLWRIKTFFSNLKLFVNYLIFFIIRTAVSWILDIHCYTCIEICRYFIAIALLNKYSYLTVNIHNLCQFYDEKCRLTFRIKISANTCVGLRASDRFRAHWSVSVRNELKPWSLFRILNFVIDVGAYHNPL